MTFPIRTTSRSLRAWYASEPERFTRERSPRRTIFWAIVALVGAVLTVVVLLDPQAVADVFGGRRRAGLAILGAFVIPPALIVCGIVFQFVWIHRFRVRDGDLVTRSTLFIVPGDLEVRDAFAAFSRGGTDPDGVRQAMRYLIDHAVDSRVQTGAKIVALAAATTPATTLAGVLRMDERKKGVLWIHQEPLTMTGEHAFDPRALRDAA